MHKNNINETVFASVISLRKALGDNSNLQIIHPGSIWTAAFIWNNPIDNDQKKVAEIQNQFAIPEDLIMFWTQIADGATLYYDQKYGQWGYKIYSSSEFQNQQLKWKQLMGENWDSNLTAIGEIIDNVHPIIARFNDKSSEYRSYTLFEGNPLDPNDFWIIMALSFHEWVDRLITAQGAKFWDWCK